MLCLSACGSHSSPTSGTDASPDAPVFLDVPAWGGVDSWAAVQTEADARGDSGASVPDATRDAGSRTDAMDGQRADGLDQNADAATAGVTGTDAEPGADRPQDQDSLGEDGGAAFGRDLPGRLDLPLPAIDARTPSDLPISPRDVSIGPWLPEVGAPRRDSSLDVPLREVGRADGGVAVESACDPAHPQNPQFSLLACPAGDVCISASTGNSVCNRGGTGIEGTQCTSSADCAPGLYCPLSGLRCVRYCLAESDCVARTCDFSLTPAQYAGSYRVGHCPPLTSVPCDPVNPQTPRSPLTACPAGEACPANYSGSTVCRPGGSGTHGSACNPSGSDCAPGYQCGATCFRDCFADADCSGGTCVFNFNSNPLYTDTTEVSFCFPCSKGLVGCHGGCVVTDDDGSNCGVCGRACATGEMCCGGTCVAQSTSGLCGCGDKAVDTDQDGVPDCVDVCPNNPSVKTPGKVAFQVAFAESSQSFSQYYNDITKCVTAAGAKWASKFPVPHDVSIEVLVDIKDLSQTSPGAWATCGPASSVFAEKRGELAIYQPGPVHEFLTGADPNGGASDILLTFNSKQWLWYDPDPERRSAALPRGAGDAESVCLHELGHALGFLSYRDSQTNALQNNVATYFDIVSDSSDGTNYYFKGPSAVDAYGSPVPETRNLWGHIGNTIGPGSDLMGTMMFGGTAPGLRQYVGPLNVAMLRDIGLPVPGSPAIEKICATASPQGTTAADGSVPAERRSMSRTLPILGPVPAPVP
jgi:hypothetical protein